MLCGPYGNDDSRHLKDMEDIGPSISKVGSSSTCEPRSSISMDGRLVRTATWNPMIGAFKLKLAPKCSLRFEYVVGPTNSRHCKFAQNAYMEPLYMQCSHVVYLSSS